MKNIGEKRNTLSDLHNLRNNAKKAVDDRDLDKFEKEISEIHTITGVMLTKIKWEREEAKQAMYNKA